MTVKKCPSIMKEIEISGHTYRLVKISPEDFKMEVLDGEDAMGINRWICLENLPLENKILKMILSKVTK